MAKVVLIVAAVFGCVLMVACAGCLMLVGSIPEATPEQRAAAKQASLDFSYIQQGQRTTEQAIKKLLKAPTTAKFDFKSRVVTGEAGKVVFIDGTVTSQNSFGAMLTSPIACVYWRENGSASNQMAYIQMDGKKLAEDAALLAKCSAVANPGK